MYFNVDREIYVCIMIILQFYKFLIILDYWDFVLINFLYIVVLQYFYNVVIKYLFLYFDYDMVFGKRCRNGKKNIICVIKFFIKEVCNKIRIDSIYY